jgi:hypothetical protein
VPPIRAASPSRVVTWPSTIATRSGVSRGWVVGCAVHTIG